MYKKIVSLFFIIALLVACAPSPVSPPAPAANEQPAAVEPAAPSQAEEEPAAPAPIAECNRPVTLDLYMVGGGDTPARPEVEAALNEYIAPLCFNVTFNIVGWGDWFSKAITGIQAGEKMDIFFTADWWQYNELVAQGLLLPLNDDNGPDGNLLDQYGLGIQASLNPAFLSGTQINGVNYAVPTNKELAVPDGLMFNNTVAEEIGFTREDANKLKSLRDMEPWLEKAKAAHPDEYPYLLNFMAPFYPYIGGLANGIPNNNLTMDGLPDANGNFDEMIIELVETEWYENHVNVIREWNQKGWVHPEAALTGYEDTPIFNSGKWFLHAQPLKGEGIKAQEMINSSGNPDLRVTEIYTHPKVVVTLHTGGSLLAIPALSDYPVEAMKFINLLHTDPTVVNIALFGVEGKHWEMEADGRVNLIDNAWYSAHPGAWVWGNTQIQLVTNQEDPDKNRMLIEYANDAVPHPSLGFRFDRTPVEAELTALTAVNDTYWTPLLYGYVDPATELPKFRAELKAAGIDVVKAELQRQYNEWKANK
jgi:putative aldouronate transport system substrate-binding protein